MYTLSLWFRLLMDLWGKEQDFYIWAIHFILLNVSSVCEMGSSPVTLPTSQVYYRHHMY